MVALQSLAIWELHSYWEFKVTIKIRMSLLATFINVPSFILKIETLTELRAEKAYI